MRKLDVTISLPTVKKENTHSEAVSHNAYNYAIEHRSEKTILHTDLLSSYPAMNPSSNTSHAPLM